MEPTIRSRNPGAFAGRPWIRRIVQHNGLPTAEHEALAHVSRILALESEPSSDRALSNAPFQFASDRLTRTWTIVE